jgi:hypothetical protein
MAGEARAPCGDCNNNNNNNNNSNNNKNNNVTLIVIVIKITDFIFYDSISLNILKFTRNNFYL